jgi:DNA-binding transcriptional MerR regulator
VTSGKDPGAFKTIGELSEQLGVAQHILRYWETKFPQLKPLQRAGNRRYYRPADSELAHRIQDLLANQGYTIRGVQRLLASKEAVGAAPAALPPETPAMQLEPQADAVAPPASAFDLQRLTRVRDQLVAALRE